MSKYITITQLAKILGLTREAIFYRIQKGQIKAEKVGHMYIIAEDDIVDILTSALTEKDHKLNREIVKKAVAQYGELFKRLAKE